MTREDALAYVKRWDEVHKVEIEEIRRTSPEAKLLQFFQLSALLEWFPRRIKRKGDAEVRRRWRVLRNAVAHG